MTSTVFLLVVLSSLVNAYSFNTNSLIRKFVSAKSPPTKIENLRKINADASFLNRRISLQQKSQLNSVDNVNEIDAKTIHLNQHSKLVQGKLANGFSYVILPNENPYGRFEAHLEVLAGSTNELENQQGIAHLLEHVAYMGSSKRQMIAGTGSRTNAYTDFHHTVFFAGCPSVTPDQFWKKPMLPMALDALVDVMTCTVGEERLEKERAAVLSEASMVNKIDYRVECQILGALHTENRISKRFPIGKENLIRGWSTSDVQRFHDTHYRPDNAVLYLVGDVQPAAAIEAIQQKFGHLKAKNDHRAIMRDSGEFPARSMHEANRHFPHVTHRWSGLSELTDSLLPVGLGDVFATSAQSDFNAIATISSVNSPMPVPVVFSHELLQSFSFHLFAKRPIEPIISEQALRRELMRRIALTALQIRLNVQQRQHPLFTSIDFSQVSWPREGCAVCSLDLTADLSTWREAVVAAITEVRRLGLFGLTESELVRYKQSLLTETAQAAAQFDQTSSEDLVQELMDHEAAGHTFMHPLTRLQTATRLVGSMTLEEVNAMARELCEHLSHSQQSDAEVRPVAIVACAPLMDRTGAVCELTESDVSSAVQEALSAQIEPLVESIVPDSLISTDLLVEKLGKHPPRFVTLDAKAAGESEQTSETLGVVQRKLSNGIRVNLKSQGGESQRARLRVYVPGGRLKESDSSPGAVEAGTRTIQEGGAFLGLTREQVELFCIDHNVMVEVSCSPSALVFDFSTVTTLGPGETVTGVEAAMQVAHALLTDFRFEEDAFQRAKQALHEQFDSTRKGLESACLESLTHSLTGGDSNYLDPNHRQLDALTLSTVQASVTAQLSPDNVEVTLSGDLALEDMEALALAYLGTVPPRQTTPAAIAESGQLKSLAGLVESPPSLQVSVLGEAQQLGVYLEDSEERAMGYLAGPSPNSWGVFSDGQTVGDRLRVDKDAKKDVVKSHREHPSFGQAALLILEEIANRRLFSVVREERRLTYDASFQVESQDAIRGGWFLVSVTSNPTEVQTALGACREALQSLKGLGTSEEGVQAAKHTLLNKRRSDLSTNKFWVDSLSGSQLPSLPTSLQAVMDFETVVQSVTVQDIRDLAGLFAFKAERTTACVGVTAPTPPLGM